jgi:choline dehydrogenase-like flavoprotein
VHIVTAVHVRRLTLDGAVAKGVEFTWNKLFLPDAHEGVHAVSARKMVLLAAGTFGTPGVLERSGVGAKEWLGKIGVDVKIELPGVGEGYQGESRIEQVGMYRRAHVGNAQTTMSSSSPTTRPMTRRRSTLCFATSRRPWMVRAFPILVLSILTPALSYSRRQGVAIQRSEHAGPQVRAAFSSGPRARC